MSSPPLPSRYRWRFDQSTLWNGLVHAWALDESSGDRGDAVGSCDLVEVGTVPAVAGLVGNAADATGGYLYNPALAESLTQKFAFAVNFKAGIGGSMLMLQFFHFPGAFFGGLLQNRVYWEVDAWTDPHASWGASAGDGLWHTIIVWVDRDEDNRIQSSLDGAATVYSAFPITGTFKVNPGLGMPIWVGYGVDGTTPTGLALQRLLWWNRSLTAGERAEIFAGHYYGSARSAAAYPYPTAGAKVCSLQVTDDCGLVATDTVVVTVT